MRPVRLTLSAFGPFRGVVEVDFSKVGDELFLIHGATGAGKSTILDGICYALYGVSAGGERRAKDLRCQGASPRSRTYVMFEFDVDRKRYRIRRSPEQEKAKARGKVTTERAAVELSVREGDGPSDESQPLLALGLESWRSLSEKAGGVAEHVDALIGLDADQFRQVVVLPQGRFREFLLAPSRERQEILESLFHTERYRNIEEEMRRRKDALQDALNRERDRRAFILEQAAVSGEAALRQRRDDVDARLVALTEEQTAQAAQLKALRDRVAEAERWAELHRRQRAATAERDGLLAEQEQMAQKRARAERLTRAKALGPDLSLLQEAERERDGAAARAAQVQQDCGAAERALTAAKAALGTDEDHDHKRAALATERAALAVHEEALGKAQRLAAEVETLAVQAQNATKARAAADEGRQQAQQNRQAADKALQQARLDAAKFEARRGQLLRLLQEQKALRRFRELAQERSDDEAARTKLAAQVAETRRALDEKRAARAHAERVFLSAQAAHLAQTLEDGAPCPVCGAHDHPAPATAGTEQGSERTWRTRTREVEQLEADLAALTHQDQTLSWRIERAAEQCRDLEEDLGERDLTVLQDALSKAEDALAKAEHAEEHLDELAARAQQCSAILSGAEQAAAAAAEAEAAARAQHDRARGQYEQLSQGLPTDAAALGERLRALDAAIVALDHGRREKQDAVLDKERALAELKGQLAQTESEQKERTALAADRRAALLTRAAAEGFADLDDLAHDAAASGEAEGLFAAVTAHQERLDRVTAETARLAETLAEAPALVADEEKQKLVQLERAHIDGARRLGELKAEAKQLSLWLSGLTETEQGEAALQDKHLAWGELTAVALGDNPLGMTFQRFVLATLLDEVLENASRRLRSMTRDRYELARARSDEPSRRRARGLELLVFDRVLGTERGVHTLSGGESFLAALALALGLADAVSARAGGRAMEAIFVDEGFGGLDPESLDLALDALSRLHAAGRMVGIISHVGELKERISTRIEVVRTPRGSRLSGQFVRAA